VNDTAPLAATVPRAAPIWPAAADRFVPHDKNVTARSDRDLRMTRDRTGGNPLPRREAPAAGRRRVEQRQRAVARHRPAEAGAILLLVHRQRRLRQRAALKASSRKNA
jgi:hypothetical protein